MQFTLISEWCTYHSCCASLLIVWPSTLRIAYIPAAIYLFSASINQSIMIVKRSWNRCDVMTGTKAKLSPVRIELTTSGFLTSGNGQGRCISLCYETDALTSCAKETRLASPPISAIYRRMIASSKCLCC